MTFKTNLPSVSLKKQIPTVNARLVCLMHSSSPTRTHFLSVSLPSLVHAGVLTKPDAIGPGAVSAQAEWAKVLNGTAHPLKHGYYCVRLPDDQQRAAGLSPQALEALASQFFNSTSPWRDIADRSRLGIPGFVSRISRLLIDIVESACAPLYPGLVGMLTSLLV